MVCKWRRLKIRYGKVRVLGRCGSHWKKCGTEGQKAQQTVKRRTCQARLPHALSLPFIAVSRTWSLAAIPCAHHHLVYFMQMEAPSGRTQAPPKEQEAKARRCTMCTTADSAPNRSEDWVPARACCWSQRLSLWHPNASAPSPVAQ